MHTKEPWSINHWAQPDSSIGIGAAGTPLIARIILRDVSINEQKANADRIVACVNALKEVPAEWLVANKSIVVLGAPIADRFREIEKQRDELLAALEGVVATMKPTYMSDFDRVRYNAARGAIAKAKEAQ